MCGQIKSQFHTDLEAGHEAEREALAMLLSDFKLLKELFVKEANRPGPEYDIALWLTAEVKWDRLEEKTDNLCFECWNGNRKWTGVFISKAELVIYKLHDRWFIFNRKELVKELHELLKGHKSLKKTRDGNAWNLILPRDFVENSFKSLKKVRLFEKEGMIAKATA